MLKQIIRILPVFLVLYVASAIVAQDDIQQTSVAQVNVSPTPIRAILSTSTPPPTELAQATPTPTHTPTPEGPILAQAAGDQPVNVRVDPEPTANVIGTITRGDVYPILGRYFRWLKIQYDNTRTGWVYDEVVEIIGVPEDIPIIDLSAQPTTDPQIIEQTQTREAITMTPGALLTLTANAQILTPPTRISNAGGNTNDASGDNAVSLPTFTPPPNFTPGVVANAAGVSISNTSTDTDTGLSIPPIAPVIVLGLLGMLGLAISSVFRN